MKKTLFLATLLTALPLGSPAEAAGLVAGSADAPVQLTIYGDIQCPFTKKLMTYLDRFETDYGTKIGIRFSHFPLAFHEQAKPAAIAAECAARQGELKAYLKEEFAHQDKLGRDFFLSAAGTVGIRDSRTFAECLDDKAVAAAVDAEYAAAEKAGVNSTPNVLIQGELVKGVYPYEDFKAKIDKALQ